MNPLIGLLRKARAGGLLASLACLLLGCHAFSPAPAPESAPIPAPPASPVSGTLRVVHERTEGFAGLGPVVVYLEPVEEIDEPAPLPAAEVRHRGHGFEPELLAIGPGQAIRLVDESGTHHRVFWLIEGARTGAELPLAPNATADLEIEARGITRLYCDLHPDEHFSVLVVPSRHFAVLDSPGPYALSMVPAGAWRLHIWSDVIAGPIRELRVQPGEASQQDIWIDARRLVKR